MTLSGENWRSSNPSSRGYRPSWLSWPLPVCQNRDGRTSKENGRPSRSPGQFQDQDQAKNFCRSFFRWYNAEHRHGGISMLTPEQVHFGHAIARRKAVLRKAFAIHPGRFVSGEPKPKPIPEAVWINPLSLPLTTQEIAL